MWRALCALAWEIWCLALVICPTCEQSMRADSGLVWMFCQNARCPSLHPQTYDGPERRKS